MQNNDTSESKLGEQFVKEHFEKLGYKVVKISEGAEKTPDFAVYHINQLLFYCEVKILRRHCIQNDITSDPTYNNIEKQARRASKQFQSYNPQHDIPNVLALVNFDYIRDANDVFITFTGFTYTSMNKYMKIRKVGRIKEDLKTIDLIMWFKKDKLEDILTSGLNQQHDKFLSQLLLKEN